MKLIAYVCLLAVLLWACEAPRKQNGEDTLPSGVKFKVLSKDTKGQKVKVGDYVVMHFTSQVGNKIIDNTYKLGEPQTIMVSPVAGMPSEVLPYLQVGDSLKITLSLDSLVKKTGNTKFFDQYKKDGNTIDYYVKVFGIKTKEQMKAYAMEQEKKAQQEAKKKQEEEIKKLEEYVQKTGKKYTKLPSGLYFLITEAKPENLKAKKGDTVMVHYTGKLIDGKVFDSSIEKDPFQFVLGMGAVIKGWDEGIAQLRKGEKATLLIPSSMGYGAQGAGMGLIPPFSTLIFDVELVDIKPAPEAKK